MHLTKAQIKEYDENGFVILHGLFSAKEIEAARADISRMAGIETDHIVREKSGTVRTIFRSHDAASPTHSRPFHAMARVPRLMKPIQDVLRSTDLYIYHSKLNLKDAIDGAIWQWHQDYGYWKVDGVPSADGMTTALVMLNEASELSGCLYFIPGSHKLGRLDPEMDDRTTSYKLWTVPKQRMIELMEEHGDPVAITGEPGTAVIFHPNIVHGSGHNMSPRARWQMYFVYNRQDNRPDDVQNPRPEYVCSRLFEPVTSGDDRGIA